MQTQTDDITSDLTIWDEKMDAKNTPPFLHACDGNGHIHSAPVIMPCLVYNVSIMPCQVCFVGPCSHVSVCLSDLSLGDVSSLCLNCSQSPVILFPTPWLMMPLKFIFMLNLVMILWGTQLFTDGSHSLAAWSLEAIFRGFLWNCTRRRKQRGADKNLHFLPPADNWRLWTWILSNFQCREDPGHNKVLRARRGGAEVGSCDINIIMDFTNYFLELLLKGCAVKCQCIALDEQGKAYQRSTLGGVSIKCPVYRFPTVYLKISSRYLIYNHMGQHSHIPLTWDFGLT